MGVSLLADVDDLPDGSYVDKETVVDLAHVGICIIVPQSDVQHSVYLVRNVEIVGKVVGSSSWHNGQWKIDIVSDHGIDTDIDGAVPRQQR